MGRAQPENIYFFELHVSADVVQRAADMSKLVPIDVALPERESKWHVLHNSFPGVMLAGRSVEGGILLAKYGDQMICVLLTPERRRVRRLPASVVRVCVSGVLSNASSKMFLSGSSATHRAR